MSLTQKQRAAVEHDGGNILVSASAGSGKTFVMMERIKRLLLENKTGVDRILCVTFTVLAAKEMKKKLSDKLMQAISEGADRQTLERQIELLPSASISTIHSFCKNLITEFFYEAGVDPAFAIVGEDENKNIVNRAIDRLFEDLYEQNDPRMSLLLSRYFKKRSDKDLKKKIIDIYGAIISEADPMGILEASERYYTKQGVEEIFALMQSSFEGQITALLEEGEELLLELDGEGRFYPFVCAVNGMLSNALQSADFIRTAELFSSLPEKPRKPTGKKVTELMLEENEKCEAFKAKLSALAKRVKKSCGESRDKEEFFAQSNAPVYQAFCFVVKKFMEYFSEEKRAENVVDYSDLEHLALKLLKNDAIRKEVSSRFDFVFTDEYQDTSGVQEGILSLVSNDNLFMVGDVKQSIYDFRGCNPDIFARKYERYKRGDGGKCVDLDLNFRSSASVINAVNRVFCSIMTKDCGMVDYAASPMEVGADYPDDGCETAMLLTQKSKKQEIALEGVYSVLEHVKALRSDKCFAEGRMVAELINELKGKSVYELGKGYRAVEYGDIAILLRSANVAGDKFATELMRAGIPVSAPTNKSLGEYAEIALALNVLQLIDCKNQDIALAAVLKSPLGEVTDEELYAIRKNSASTTFVDAVSAYRIQKTDQLAKKLELFETRFDRIRLYAEFAYCDEVLTHVISQTRWDVKLLATPAGEVKLARLNAFISALSAKKRTVGEFVKNADTFLKELTVNFENENAVKIMSIHASKGLEFPIVILSAIGSPKRSGDSGEGFLIDKEMGLALEYYDQGEMRRYSPVFYNYVKAKKQKREREEEMRLLYVAMTRAKNSLFLTGEYSERRPLVLKSEHGDNDVIDADCYFKMFAEGDVECKQIALGEGSFKTQERKQVLVGEADERLRSVIAKNLNFSYPHEQDVHLEVKCSVTKAVESEAEEVNFARSFVYGESDTQTGNAYHKFLELCDFKKEPEDEINRLIGGLLLTEEEKSLLKREKLASVLSLPIFKEISKYELYREQPFTAFIPVSLLSAGASGGEVLVQGIIDLLAINGDEAVIVDYKHTTIASDKQLVERYKKQLELYAYAVQRVLGKRVVGAYLVNVYAARTVKVEL